MRWNFWKKNSPGPDKPYHDDATQALFDQFTKNCLAALETHRDTLIHSPTKRMEVVFIFMQHFGLVATDVQTLLDEFAQIQIARELGNERSILKERLQEQIDRRYGDGGSDLA